MKEDRELFDLIDKCVEPVIEKDIYVYGCNAGGMFLKWYLKQRYKKGIVSFVDKYAVSPTSTVLHLIGLYYIEKRNAVIINVTPRSIVEDVEATGDQWSHLGIEEEQIIDLWSALYKGDDVPTKVAADYYSWMEYKYGLSLTDIVKSDQVVGEKAHGYYPVDYCSMRDCMRGYQINQKDSVLDIGAGKGSGVIALRSCGFRKIGAVEYTKAIFRDLKNNLQKLGWGEEIACWNADAGLMTYELDQFNWFYLFNPFGNEVFEKVFGHILESIERKPRQTHIIYAEPMAHATIMKTGRFSLDCCWKEDYWENVYWINIYKNKL